MLQSRASGLAYLTRYAIPSIKSASSGEGEHYNSPSEQDASVRAFLYFNEHVDGFYKTELGNQKNGGWGWNFERNRINRDGMGVSGLYTDYKNPQHIKQIKSLILKPRNDYALWNPYTLAVSSYTHRVPVFILLNHIKKNKN